MTRFALRQLRKRLARRAEQLIIHVQLAARSRRPLTAREGWLKRCGRDVAEALAELVEGQEQVAEDEAGCQTFRTPACGQ